MSVPLRVVRLTRMQLVRLKEVIDHARRDLRCEAIKLENYYVSSVINNEADNLEEIECILNGVLEGDDFVPTV